MENYKALLKNSILKIQEKDRRIAALEAEKCAPIAIIAASGCFPGSRDLNQFWSVIERGTDALTTMIAQRWNMDDYYAARAGTPGHINTRRFGLIDGVDLFDPAAFGISDAEAENMDPQHRLLLEHTWFCFERAGLDVEAMKGTDVGVFIGQMNNDYTHLVKDVRDLTPYFGIGNALSAAAGRLSYVFGLQGPSIAIDTACSSSLVAVHLACQSLRMGECSMALAGGVNLLLSPEAAIGASVAKMLSSQGRCNTFGAAADGYIRSEGCGLVLLKTLARAQEEGAAILAVIRGSAVNQDGRSNGMNAPSGPAQIDVMRRALANAELEAAQIDYIETHGTGTPLGDPVEVQAIDAVYGCAPGRHSPLTLGAVKANIGHCESAAGIAGLLKVVLMLQHQLLPAIAHLVQLNPHFVALSEYLYFPKGESRPWTSAGTRLAAVSSFGYTGTNAHLLVEQYTPPKKSPSLVSPSLVSPSLVSPSSVSSPLVSPSLVSPSLVSSPLISSPLVSPSLISPPLISSPLVSPSSVSSPLVSPPLISSLRHVFCFSAHSQHSLREQLLQTLRHLDGDPESSLPRLANAINRIRKGLSHRVAIVAGSREELRKRLHEAVASELGGRLTVRPRCHFFFGAGVDQHLDVPWHWLFMIEEPVRRLRVALEKRVGCTLEALLMDEGGRCQQTLRHFIIQYLYASLWQTLRLAPDTTYAVGRGALAAAVFAQALSLEQALELAIGLENALTPEAVIEQFDKINLTASLYPLSMYCGERAEEFPYTVPAQRVAWLSRALTTSFCDVAWSEDMAMGEAALAVDMARCEILCTADVAAPQERFELPDAVAMLFRHGLAIDCSAFDRDGHGFIELADYPFDRRRYWLAEHVIERKRAFSSCLGAFRHGIFSTALSEPDGDSFFFGEISIASLPYLKEHVVMGQTMLPASAYVDMLLSACLRQGNNRVRLQRVRILQPCILGERPVPIYCRLSAVNQENIIEAKIFSRQGADSWKHHVFAVIETRHNASLTPSDRHEIQQEALLPLPVLAHYARARRAGIDYGPSFQAIRALSRAPGCALAKIELPNTLAGEETRHDLHPVLLDACLQSISAVFMPASEGDDKLFIPAEFHGFVDSGARPSQLWCWVRLLGASSTAWADEHAVARYLENRENFSVSMMAWDEQGTTVFALDRLEAMRLRNIPTAVEEWERWIYKKRWVAVSPPALAAFAPFDQLVSSGQQYFEAWRKDGASDTSDALNALACDYLRDAWVKLGVSDPGTSVAALLEVYGVVPEYERLCGRLLTQLQCHNAPPDQPGEALMRHVAPRREDPLPLSHEFDLLARCGSALAEILMGKRNALDLLFGSKAVDHSENVYEATAGTRLLNNLIAETVRLAVESRQSPAPVRILEVGAGTGATTRQLLEHLQGLNVEYTFTDISEHFISRAQSRFLDDRRVKYRLFDISADPGSQGLSVGAFDIIIAVNVIHSTADVAQTLRNLKTCLAEGGLLFVRELTRSQIWLDLTFGLMPGWWRFSDTELRQDGPLLDVTQWQTLFQTLGCRSAALTGLAETNPETVFLVQNGRVDEPSHAVLFSNQDTVSKALERALMAKGRQVSVVVIGHSEDGEHYAVAPNNCADFLTLFERIAHERGPIHEVVYAWSLHQETLAVLDLAVAVEPFAKYPLLLCQALLQTQWRHVVLSVLTAGAQTDRVDNPWAAMLWGHVFTYINENNIFARLIDIDLENFSMATVLDVLERRDECQWMVSGNQLRFARLAPEKIASREQQIRDDASYLITGGYGDLGLQTAVVLAQLGARHIILVGRHIKQDDKAPLFAQLRDSAVMVYHVQADVGDEPALRRALAACLPGLPPLRGMVHAVGVLDDGVIEKQTWERYLKVLVPKVFGAIYLDRIAREHDLDFFVIYSSAAGILGNPGQANHAAANAFLDALALHRCARGLPGLAIDWGAWSDIGAAAEHDIARRLNEKNSVVGMIPPKQGRSIVARQFAATNGQFAVVPLRAPQSRAAQRGLYPYLQKLLSEVLVTEDGVAAPSTRTDDIDLKARLSRLAGTDRRQYLAEHLHKIARGVLKYDGHIDPAVSLFEIGLDSLLAIDLRAILERDFQCQFDSTLLFDYPNLSALVEFLLPQLDGTLDKALPNDPAHDAAKLAAQSHQQYDGKYDGKYDGAIAVIGMGCRFPGGVQSAEQFWALLSQGIDTATPIPGERWDNAAYFDAQKFKPGKIYVNAGCFIEQVDLFYPERYGISGIEAHLMDPQQRLLLDVCYEALESAAMAPDAINGKEVGVFMGSMTQDYLRLSQNVREHLFYVGTGTANSILAGRVSHVFGLTGPTMTVDTACSSSLVTVQLACLNLRLGTCDMALAGGVSLQLVPETMALECAGGMLSHQGRCRTFDANADGFVRGEGCGVVVLKRLEDALAAEDIILGVIRGAAVTHDGRAGGLTVPNGWSQQRVLEKALRDAALSPQDISYVEAHGTATQLGDPIELNALQAVYGKDRRGEKLWVGSVKTNIGHAEAAAGIAGLQKVILSLRHQAIPPHLHLDQPTPNFNWEEGMLAVPQTLTPWQAQGPRRAAVSSFGLSGTNAHVILEEYTPAEVFRTTPRGFTNLVMLSNVSLENLALDAAAYARAIRAAGDDIVDVAYTLCVSRASQPLKVLMAAESAAMLLANLEALAQHHVAEMILLDARTLGTHFLTLVFENSTHEIEWAEWAVDYYEQYPVFRDAIDECIAHWQAQGVSNVDAFGLCSGRTLLSTSARHGVLQYAYARLLFALGITPRRLSACGWGLFCAARLAGIVSTEQMLVALRAAAHEIAIVDLLTGLNPSAAQIPILLVDAAELPGHVAALAADLFAVTSPEAVDETQQCRLSLAAGRLSKETSPSWTRRLPALPALLIELAEIGQTITWKTYFSPAKPRKVLLPVTHFPTKRFWIPEQNTTALPEKRPPTLAVIDMTVACGQMRYVEFDLSMGQVEGLLEHAVHGVSVLPAACGLALVVHAHVEALQRNGICMNEVAFTRPVTFHNQLTIQLAMTAGAGAQLYFKGDADESQGGAWKLFSTLSSINVDMEPDGMEPGGVAAQTVLASLEELLTAPDLSVARDVFYAEHLPANLQLGKSYRRILQVWRKGTVAVAQVENLNGVLTIDPRLLDACIQTVNFIDDIAQAQPDDLFLPFAIASCRLTRWPDSQYFWCVAQYQPLLSHHDELVYDITVMDDEKRVCAEFHRFTYKRVAQGNTWMLPTASTVVPLPEKERQVFDFAALSEFDLLTRVTGLIRERLAEFLNIDVLQIADERAFFDIGMDSITAVDFSTELGNLFVVPLHADTVFDYPHVSALAKYIVEQMTQAEKKELVTQTQEKTDWAAPASMDELAEMLRFELNDHGGE